MIDRIVQLSNDLRDAGIAVSIRSTYSALLCCQELSQDGGDVLKMALRSIYVKDKYDIAKFDRIFDRVFRKDNSLGEDLGLESRSGAYSGSGPRSNRYVIKKADNRVKKLRKERLNNEVLKQLSGRPFLDEMDRLEREGELVNRDLTKLNRFDPRMLEICQRLGKKIANKRSRRKNRSNVNRVDMRRTMRANLRYGGVPIKLIKSKPRLHKNQHLFLNDISGSCEWISSWFFMLMYSCQSAFKNSRTFEFDNKVIETTDALKEDEMLDSFIKVKDLRMRNSMIHGSSNMYSAFKQFIDKVDLNNKSYVLILSDCRDWGGPKKDKIPQSVELVEEMVRESKKVVILNPEDRNKWDIVDSCVGLYEDVGARVFEVNTLNQLAQFVESM